MPPSPWPYPSLFAHRLGGALAPENTLAGLRLAARLGVRAVECDVKLSADGVPFLLHDDTLERTTDGHGPAATQPWAALQALDAGCRHHRAFAGEPLPTLAALADACLQLGVVPNLEIKPCPGRDAETGRQVALAAERLWRHAPLPPLLSSFSPDALQAAAQAAPTLPRALLLEKWEDNAAAQAAALGVRALHLPWQALTPARAAALKDAGYALMAWTVNDPREAARLTALGVDMVCSDRPELF
ncbi:glycerophosphodiester phosphodiesterase [Crenobacter caeni]|uniref:Glycerophosphodiester phosphodiesterase n=1 Tax=Crenobacter caeni TaxID=2705474 RepID=A0A6B2KVY6_9NEIS|nr:glycerophosphodiester phosphodiesterase [Crenobacter caeni]NDV14254.1 glycerophosphodiester phosphodiesterase [Crenobacter caeni]